MRTVPLEWAILNEMLRPPTGGVSGFPLIPLVTLTSREPIPNAFPSRALQTCSSNDEVITHEADPETASLCLLGGAQERRVAVDETFRIGQLNSPELHFIVFQRWKSVNYAPFT